MIGVSEAQEKKTEDSFEGLKDLISYLLKDYKSAIQATSNLPIEVLYYAKRLIDEYNCCENRDFFVEINRIQVLNELLNEIVKTDRDHNFFLWRDNVAKYLEIMSKLATIWRTFDTTDRPEKNVKVDQILEIAKAVEGELKSLLLRIIDYSYHCNDPDEEEFDDEEPEES